MQQPNSYREVLHNVLSSRQRVNPAYSLRAFARDIDLSPSRLSEVLNSGHGLSLRNAQKISVALGMEGEDREFFCDLVASESNQNIKEKKLAATRVAKYRRRKRQKITSVEAFDVVSGWEHFAILELMNSTPYQLLQPTKDHSQDPITWVAKKLSMTRDAVSLAYERMRKLKMVRKVKNKYELVEADRTTLDGVDSSAIKSYHESMVGKASSAIYMQLPTERYLSSTNFAFNKDQLEAVKKAASNFEREISDIAKTSSEKEEVYTLNIQFFRLTEKGDPVDDIQIH